MSSNTRNRYPYDSDECDVDIGPYIEKICCSTRRLSCMQCCCCCCSMCSTAHPMSSSLATSIRPNDIAAVAMEEREVSSLIRGSRRFTHMNRSFAHGPPESAFLEAPLLLMHDVDTNSDNHYSQKDTIDSRRSSGGGLLNEALLLDVSLSDDDDAEFNQVPKEYHRNHKERLKILVNHNVLVMFVLAVFTGVVDSLWGGTVFELWVTQWADGDKYDPYAGYAASASMIITFCLAYPFGFIADQSHRSKVSLIHLGSKVLFIGSTLFLGLIVSLSIVDSSDEDEYINNNSSDWCFVLFCVVLLLSVIGDVAIRGPANALFADCLQNGARMQKYCILYCLIIAPKFVGPLTSFILYDADGDIWTKGHVRAVMYATSFVALIICCIMRYFDQSKVPSFHCSEETSSWSATDLSRNQQLPSCNQEKSDIYVSSRNAESDHAQLITSEFPRVCKCLSNLATNIGKSKVPWVLIIQNYICAIGGGLFELWWPRMLTEETSMTIKETQLLLLVMPLITCLVIVVLYRLALLNGRAWVMFYGKVAALMFISLSALIASIFTSTSVKRVSIPFVVLYRSVMHGSMPIEMSVLVDFVEEASRARWIAMYTSAEVIWSGSAIIGESLLNVEGYMVPLFLTAFIQGIALPLLTLLFPSIPIRENDIVPERNTSKQTHQKGSVADDVLDQNYLQLLANHTLL